MICYNRVTMTQNASPIDITNIPELVRMAEEVRDSKKPRILKGGQHNEKTRTRVKEIAQKGLDRDMTRSIEQHEGIGGYNSWILPLMISIDLIM